MKSEEKKERLSEKESGERGKKLEKEERGRETGREEGRKRRLAEKCLQVVNDGWLDRFLAKITFCCEIAGNVWRRRHL